MHDFMHIQRFFMSYKSVSYLQFMWRVLAQKKSHIVHGHMGYQCLYIWWARRDSNPGPTD